MPELSAVQKEVLDRLVQKFLEGPNILVQGTNLRLLMPQVAVDDRGDLLRSLCPRYAKMSGQEPDQDFWEPTLEGLLLSSSKSFASFWIEQTLQLFRRKAEKEGAFTRYVWSELKAQASGCGRECDDDQLIGVALVIRAAGLERTGSKAPPPDFWYWTRPEKFEQLHGLRTVQDLLAFRLQGASPATDLTKPGTTRAALLAVERGVARTLRLGEPPEAIAPALTNMAAALPEPFATQGNGIVSALTSSQVSIERRKMALLRTAEWARRMHREHTFIKGSQVSDAHFVAFLKALLKLDDDLPIGATISIELAGRKARLADDVLDLCAARALDEELAYVSDIDAQPYAIQIHEDEVHEELERLKRSSEPVQSAPAMASEMLADVAIITIRDDEFEAVLDAFPQDATPPLFIGVTSKRHYNLRMADAGAGKQYRVAVVRQTEQGTGEGQALARDCVEDIRPLLVLVVGIAGAPPINDLTLGDVVLSLRVHDYTVHANKSDNTTEYSIGGGGIADSIARGVANLRARKAELGEWWAGLPSRPTVQHALDAHYTGDAVWKERVKKSLEHHFEKRPRVAPIFVAGDLASSDALVKDPAVIIQWLATARNIRAIEMESCGVYRGTRDRTAMLAVRGISDIVGFQRDEDWTTYACHSAAKMARAYLRTTPVEPRGNAAVERGSSPGADEVTAKRQVAGAPASARSTAQSPDPRLIVWQLHFNTPAFPGTKAELHTALNEAITTYDLRNAQRTARWPRVLVMPQVARSTEPDGATLWTHSYAREEMCPRGVEQFWLRREGQVMFQRSSFHDIATPAVNFGDLAFDVVLFAAFAARYAWRLGLSGHVDAKISLSAASGAQAIFHATPVAPKEAGTASFTAGPVEGTVRISTQDYASRTMLVEVALRLLDRIANEFVLQRSCFGSTPGSGFLSIARPSVEALASLLLGAPPGTEFADLARAKDGAVDAQQ